MKSEKCKVQIVRMVTSFAFSDFLTLHFSFCTPTISAGGLI
jgi:hypothetical protein